MKKEDAIKIITDCAKLYHENLEGRYVACKFLCI